ncbi:MAG: GSU2403 family nucleotidyltransferase fold protein [Elusimicrobiota bacterium]
MKKEKNLHELLERLNFKPLFNYSNGLVKYEHPELEVEFLTPKLGKGRKKPYEIKKLHVNVRGLRFLNFLQGYTLKIKDGDIEVTVPQPAAFVLHKFIISQRRKNPAKAKRDIDTAKNLGEFLFDIDKQREKIKNIFLDIPKSWQQKILDGVKGNSAKIHRFITSF